MKKIQTASVYLDKLGLGHAENVERRLHVLPLDLLQ